MARYLESSAELSEDGCYRYWLSRRLSMGERAVLFVGLNPSTADATEDDPTIRRCVGFARAWGFDWLFMGNLHGWRSTDPKGLLTVDEPVGPDNAEALRWMSQKSELVIAAWGANPLHKNAVPLSALILALPHTRVLGLNKDGSPKHPLYLSKSVRPVAVSEAQR